jgi:O-antigen ligase
MFLIQQVVIRKFQGNQILDILIEVLFLAFLLAGSYKGDPRLQGFPVDLTLLTFSLSLALVLFRFFLHPQLDRGAIVYSLLFCLFAGFVLLSSIYSRFYAVGMEKGWRFLLLTGWGSIGPLFFMRQDSFRRLPLYLILFATFAAGDGLFTYLTSSTYRLQALGLNYGSFSQFVAVAFPFAYGYLLRGKGFLATVSSFIVCGLFILAVLLSAGKAGIVAIALTIFLMPLFYQSSIRRKVGTVLLFLVIIVVILFSFSNYLSGTYMRFVSLLEGKEERLFMFDAALDLWQKHLVIGAGSAGYAAQLPWYFPNPLEAYPHSLFLEVASEQGLIGLLFLIGIIVYALVTFLRNRKGKDPQLFATILAAFTSVIFFAFVSKSIIESKIFFYVCGLMVAYAVLPKSGRSIIAGAES